MPGKRKLAHHEVPYLALELKYQLRKRYPQLEETGLDLLVSAMTEYNQRMPTESFFQWLENQNRQTRFEIKEIPLTRLKNWHFDNRGNIHHDSGKFFSIEGLHVKTNTGNVMDWKQPIINQPEVGILGILCQKYSGILYFLLQAKIEPGNVNKIQISPTVQATKSNYSQVHGGDLPPYLAFFLNTSRNKIIVDQLQSEQGARFFKKRNRNIILEVPQATRVNLLENYCWLSLGQIKKLLKHDNIINMDTRTVLSCTQLGIV